MKVSCEEVQLKSSAESESGSPGGSSLQLHQGRKISMQHFHTPGTHTHTHIMQVCRHILRHIHHAGVRTHWHTHTHIHTWRNHAHTHWHTNMQAYKNIPTPLFMSAIHNKKRSWMFQIQNIAQAWSSNEGLMTIQTAALCGYTQNLLWGYWAVFG